VHVGVASHYSRAKVCRSAVKRQWLPRTHRKIEIAIAISIEIRVLLNEGSHSPASGMTKSAFIDGSFVEGVAPKDDNKIRSNN